MRAPYSPLSLIVLSFFWCSACFAGIFGPRTYEDCILEGVKGAKTDDAVTAIYFACEKKYPSKEKLNPDELVVCGENKFGKNERTAISEIPPSEKFGSVSIVSSKWDGKGNLVVKIQNNYPFALQSARISGSLGSSKNDPIAYECSGYAGPKVVGAFICNGFDNRIKKFNVQSLTSVEVNTLEFFKTIGRCK